MALAERACLDNAKFEWLQKEWDHLLWTVEGLHRERDVAHHSLGAHRRPAVDRPPQGRAREGEGPEN
jgi:hypothetical protein